MYFYAGSPAYPSTDIFCKVPLFELFPQLSKPHGEAFGALALGLGKLLRSPGTKSLGVSLFHEFDVSQQGLSIRRDDSQSVCSLTGFEPDTQPRSTTSGLGDGVTVVLMTVSTLQCHFRVNPSGFSQKPIAVARSLSLWACPDPLPRAAIGEETAGQSSINHGAPIAHRFDEQGPSWPERSRIRP